MFLLSAAIVFSTTVQLEIINRISSSTTTATYQTGVQSKISFKIYQSLPTTPGEHFDVSL